MCDNCAGVLHEEKQLQFTRRFCAEHRISTGANLQIWKWIGVTIASSFMLWSPSAAPLSLRCPYGPAWHMRCSSELFLFLWSNTSMLGLSQDETVHPSVDML